MAAFRALLACLLLASLVSGCMGGLSSSPPAPAEGSRQAEDSGLPESTPENPQGADDGASPGQSGPVEPQPTDGPASQATPGDPLRADPPTGAKAGTPATHGDAKRTEGQVSVEVDGNQYIARRTVTIENDFGGAKRSHLSLSTFNGDVAVRPSMDGGYLLSAELFGRGTTQEEARKALDLLGLDATDDLQGDRIDLGFTLTSDPPEPMPIPILQVDTVNNGGALTLWVPPQPAHELEANSTNGDVEATGLHGPRHHASSINGDIIADGSWDRVEATTTNGAIRLGGGTINDITAANTNGDLTVVAIPSRTSTVRLTSNNGDIEVDVPRDPGLGFDVEGDTTNGEVTIAVEGHDVEAEGHGEYRSDGWSTARIQLTLDLQSNNGSIVVED